MTESSWLYPFLFAGGLAAGWVDSIAGGGGLITIPLLLGIGLPPQCALGTNKLQASFGSLTAAYYYVRKGLVDLHEAWPGIVWTLVGAGAGAWAVQQLRQDVLDLLIPFLLIGIAVYMLVTPPASDHDIHPRMGRIPFYVLSGAAFGFYDGFFGPGVGSFWAFAFIAALGFNLTKATAHTKVMNFTSNVVSFFIFLAGGVVLILPGLVMAAGQIVGARIGSSMVVQRGAKFIRPIFIGVVLLTTLKLLYNRFA
jgi:uncharacterized protein